jgi:hypothetical protein
MKLLIALLILTSFYAYSEVNPSHVESMLDQMVRENVIGQEEANKAKIKLRSMNKDQWKQINVKAESIASRTPASEVSTSNTIEEAAKNIDLDGAQFKQIQDDMKKIVPELGN